MVQSDLCSIEKNLKLDFVGKLRKLMKNEYSMIQFYDFNSMIYARVYLRLSEMVRVRSGLILGQV